MGDSEKERQSNEALRSDTSAPVLPTTIQDVSSGPVKQAPSLHPAVYIATWISLSSSVILFNKWILDTANFHYPIVLTTWHLSFATLMTQLMARFTPMLDSRKKVPMTGRVYLRAIVPIGLFFSLSLICGNLTYLYLSVSFIQMLKATTPVAVLLASWAFGTAAPSLRTLLNVSAIVVGVIIASLAEIQFVLIGFLFQIGGITFEATRLVMVEKLLSSAEFKMDPLVSLYYYAPCCAIMNAMVALVVEVPHLTMAEIYNVGLLVLLANGVIAFLLNVSVVFLIGKTSSLVLTLSGVLKDILLVCASLVIFRDPVTGTQVFGYSIAICGLLYYKLGGDKLRGYYHESGRQWREYGAKHPAMQKVVIFTMVVFILIVIMGGAWPFIPAGLTESLSTMSVGSANTGGA